MGGEWRKTQLGGLLDLEYGVSLQADFRTGSEFPVYGSNGEVGRHDRWLIEGPGIVVGRKGSVGAVTWVDEPFWPIDTTYYVRPRDGTDLRWLYYCLKSLPLKALDSSTGVPGLNRNDAYVLAVPLPPLTEQRRIAEILDTVGGAIRKTEQLIAKLQQMKQGLLHDLLTRGIDPHGHLRDPQRHPEQFKDSPLGRIPKDWEVSTVGQEFEIQLGKMLNKAARQGRHPRKYIGNRAVQWERVDLSELETMDFSPSEQDKFSLRPLDLLVCEGGDVGRTAIWNGEKEDIYFQKAIHRLRTLNDFDPRLMLRYMRFAKIFGKFNNFTSQTSIAHLTREKLSQVVVPLIPTDEQQRIVAAIESLELLDRTSNDELLKLRSAKQGLMNDLLNGGVRVSTSPRGGIVTGSLT